MKSTIEKIENKVFTPIKLEIIIETQEDLDKWGSLMNCPKFDAFCSKFGFKIPRWDQFKSLGASISKFVDEFNTYLGFR